MWLNSISYGDSASSKRYKNIVTWVCGAVFISLASPSHGENKQKSHYEEWWFVTTVPNGYTWGQSEFCMLNNKNSIIVDENFLSTTWSVCDSSLQTTTTVQTRVPQYWEFPEYLELLSQFFNWWNIQLRHANNFPDWNTEINSTNSQIIVHEWSNSLVVINEQWMMLPISYFQLVL